MRKLLLSAIVAISAFASQARAEFISGNELLNYCTEEEPKATFHIGICYGYAEVAASIYEVPDRLTALQARDIMVRWLIQHPEQRHHGAAVLAMKAISETFPQK